ncbi:MAG TPA: protein kinase [Polyangiaceae bacterium]|nr:protein kinase [Polyangiaceae bacterium]
MQQRPGAPKNARDGGAPGGASSGDVRVDEGDRVYVAEGDLVAGKYRVERILGVGGVGFVVAARHAELGGHFALKFLKKRFLNDRTIVERFTREARAACRIKSEYVARVYDVGAHGRAPFIVMEHLVGRDLATVLAERGAFAIGDAVEIAVQSCAALAVAHASGIVHRDIKPENLFLVDEEGLPTIKLLDFGISKIALASDRPTDEWGTEGEPITGTLICGTPFYMSPEQVRSTASVDARSDQWSLGMVLYELLVGATAFQAEALMDVCTAILDQQAPWLTDVRPDVPPGLADVVARSLQKDPASRFGSIAEMAVALLPFAPPRALAIAEGSAWIRRAAIQTLGSQGGDGRISGRHSGAPGAPSHSAMPVASGPAAALLAPPVPPSMVTTSPSSRPARGASRLGRWQSPRGRIAVVAGAALVLGSVAALTTAALLRSHIVDPPPRPASAATAAETLTAAPLPSPTAAPLQPPTTGASSHDEHAPTATASHAAPAASPVAAPAGAPAAAGHAQTPAHQRAPAAHAQPSAKPPSTSGPTSAEPGPAAPVVAPPVAPGRPDLGY